MRLLYLLPLLWGCATFPPVDPSEQDVIRFVTKPMVVTTVVDLHCGIVQSSFIEKQNECYCLYSPPTPEGELSIYMKRYPDEWCKERK